MAKGYKTVVYRAADGWRWHTLSRNGRKVGESGEAYTNRSKAVDGYRRMVQNAPAEVEFQKEVS